MPSFDINPAAGTQVLGDPNSGSIVTLKKVKGKRKLQPQDAYVAPDKPVDGGSSTSSGSSDSSKKKPGKKKPPKKEAPAAYNPLYSEFKTPADLRKDAAELAAMGVGSEDALRATAAQQQAGLSGLTNALTGTLTGIADRTQAGLAGFGNLYANLANTAQSAGQSAAAAAGAPTSVAPGGTATVASNLANLSAPTMGYAPAAAVTGAQMQGAVTANLTKALMDRSSKLSADTAKYLYQLKNDEVQRAISQGTLSQNAARLNLSAQNQTWDQQVDTAKLAQGQQRIDIQAQRAAAQIQKDLAKSAEGATKKIQSTKNSILGNVQKWTKPKKIDTGDYNWTLSIGGKDYKATGSSVEDAKSNLGSGVDQSLKVDSYQQNGIVYQNVAPNNEDVIKLLQPLLVNAGMKPKNARAWILTNVLQYVPSSSAPSGAFLGGVGGSGV